MARELAPAVGGDLAVLGVEAHDDVAAERTAGIAQETGVLHRGGADDDVRQAVVEVALDGAEIANAAAQLHGDVFAHFLDDGANGRLVARLASECAVQVHQVQTPRALLDPMPGHGSGVLREYGGLIHVALFEANTLTVFKVDGRDEQHRQS